MRSFVWPAAFIAPTFLLACGGGCGRVGPDPDAGVPSACASAELEGVATCLNEQGTYREAFVDGNDKPIPAVEFQTLWSRDELCEGLDVVVPGTRDYLARPRDFAVGKFVVDGIEREAVIALLDDEAGTKVLAVLDLATGTPLHCFFLSSAAEAGFIVRSAERVDVFSTPADELLTPVSLGVMSIDRIDLRNASVQRFTYFLGERSAARGVQVAPLGSRALAVAWGKLGIFGLDPDRAARAVWCTPSEAFGAKGTDTRWLANRDGYGAIVVQGARERAFVVSLDGCGQTAATTSTIDGLVTVAPAFLPAQATAAMVNDASADGYGLQLGSPTQTRRELHCFDATQLSDDRWACMATGENGGGVELRTFDSNGENRHVTRLPSTIDGKRAGFKVGLTAAAGGIILAVSQVGEPPDFRLVAFSDTDGIHQVGGIDLPRINVSSIDSEPPVVTEDGTVLVKVSGSLVAFRSNLVGLAPSAYPRGTSYGGNLNLGGRIKAAR